MRKLSLQYLSYSLGLDFMCEGLGDSSGVGIAIYRYFDGETHKVLAVLQISSTATYKKVPVLSFDIAPS